MCVSHALTHCAVAVAIAAPVTPKPHTNINNGSSTKLTAPTTMAFTSPAFGSPMPLGKIQCGHRQVRPLKSHERCFTRLVERQDRQRNAWRKKGAGNTLQRQFLCTDLRDPARGLVGCWRHSRTDVGGGVVLNVICNASPGPRDRSQSRKVLHNRKHD